MEVYFRDTHSGTPCIIYIPMITADTANRILFVNHRTKPNIAMVTNAICLSGFHPMESRDPGELREPPPILNKF